MTTYAETRVKHRHAADRSPRRFSWGPESGELVTARSAVDKGSLRPRYDTNRRRPKMRASHFLILTAPVVLSFQWSGNVIPGSYKSNCIFRDTPPSNPLLFGTNPSFVLTKGRGPSFIKMLRFDENLIANSIAKVKKRDILNIE